STREFVSISIELVECSRRSDRACVCSDVGFDLLFGIMQFVKGRLYRGRNNPILQADRHGDKGIVFGFNAKLKRYLFRLQGKRRASALKWPRKFDRQTRFTIASVTAERFKNSHVLLGCHDKEALKPTQSQINRHNGNNNRYRRCNNGTGKFKSKKIKHSNPS